MKKLMIVWDFELFDGIGRAFGKICIGTSSSKSIKTGSADACGILPPDGRSSASHGMCSPTPKKCGQFEQAKKISKNMASQVQTYSVGKRLAS